VPLKKISKYTIKEDFKLPDGMPDGCWTLIHHLFKPHERLYVVRARMDDESDKETISGGEWFLFEAERYLEMLEHKAGGRINKFWNRAREEKHGVYFCVNPLGKTSDQRLTENIADFRYALIEFDSIPREHQYQIIQQSRIPCKVVTDSGGKSIHAIVKINARNLNEYRERVGMLMEHFREYGVDPKTKDPTRLSRLPGCVREDTDGEQKLLNLDIGFETFEEWAADQACQADSPPEKMEWADLRAFDQMRDPCNLIGSRFLCRGSSFIISGQSGIGKSSFALQMCISFAIGRSFFGIKALRPLKIMVIQSENDLGDMAEAVQGIWKALDLNDDEIKLLYPNLIILRDRSHTGPDFLSVLHNEIAKNRPDVVLIDPLLAFVGDDIGEAKVIGRFFRQGLSALMQVTEVVLIFMHHVPKPSQDKNGKNGWTNKDLSYAGSGSSDLTNWARAIGILQKLGNLDAYQFIVTKREKRTGMVNEEGELTEAIQLQHGKDGIFWEYMDKGMREAWEEEKAVKLKVKWGKPGKPKKSENTPAKLKAMRQFFEESTELISCTALKEAIGRIYGVSSSKWQEQVLQTQLIEQGWVIKEEIPDSKNGEQRYRFTFCNGATISENRC
jgi:RecA-family ATPase